ncbi:hypothetical protein L227DRAFT_405702 [Lentinus tigrinus ALCF2SS1-6]|uniref:Uncharacterized protein n=1 Tax=Lentinus tigrinus ALCF2SS1-6 TaxID=1328759 RepID=A0A5C2RSK5_9APHY|nr:hypothetical protein L227DRAFT_405702 [Lentinus tigrinus ALCF2SS1-6]
MIAHPVSLDTRMESRQLASRLRKRHSHSSKTSNPRNLGGRTHWLIYSVSPDVVTRLVGGPLRLSTGGGETRNDINLRELAVDLLFRQHLRVSSWSKVSCSLGSITVSRLDNGVGEDEHQLTCFRLGGRRPRCDVDRGRGCDFCWSVTASPPRVLS